MLTLADPLDHARRTAGDRTALVCGNVRGDYAALHDRCARLVGALFGLGVQAGDRVAVLSLNCHRMVETFFAVPAGGLVVVPLNTRLATAEVGAILADARATVLLTDRDPGPLAAHARHVVRYDDGSSDGYEALLAAADPARLGAEAGVQEDDLAAMFYTGGTTGRSKGVMLTHRNLVANAYHKTLAVRIDTDDVFLAAPALFHVAGTAPLHGLCWRGAATVVMPTFEAAGALGLIARHGVTFAIPVPTMLAAMVDEQRARPSNVDSLRLLGHAASPIASDLLRRVHDTFPRAQLAHFYGATETCSIVTHLLHEERSLDSPLLGSCGIPAPGVQVRILGPGATTIAGAEQPARAVGEIVVRGPKVMVGYWDNPEATEAAMLDGWYRTGDLGWLDEHANLFVVDRAKDMIVSGGENVYSVEVEDVLARHPAVAEVAVFGVPDERWGEAVHAVVVLRGAVDDEASLVAELRAHCRATIAAYKVPKMIELRAEPLPKSGPGKVLKRAIRDPHWTGRVTQV